jgi:hypothetical protein
MTPGGISDHAAVMGDDVALAHARRCLGAYAPLDTLDRLKTLVQQVYAQGVSAGYSIAKRPSERKKETP